MSAGQAVLAKPIFWDNWSSVLDAALFAAVTRESPDAVPILDNDSGKPSGIPVIASNI